ncbi:peroxiredoxin [Comamonas endophytica]|uniref:thioredoxin-dependent peroxiredoxin n=1 Tax=Comamonas endophytica TaxID=2949090 RepID=A0ABY6GBX3_9BURK|nr:MULTISPECIES: peroxiredoxin [unclassified Acidovorax]MCD2513069.1 peroxiredoxin [Acidovorax sp. D4N7]UYG52591.1 peroxiredoxin [Acidovorax sp. 5MLIR]
MRSSGFGVRAAFPAALVLAALFSTAAHAVLKPGDAAPTFTTQAAVAGKPFAFNLQAALQKGPVVLYFFPKAFTQGCTLEAHAFAEATPRFKALGAQVVGMSHDDIDTLQRFSEEACRDQFAVASDPQARTIQAYDAAAAANPQRADRISYVIGQDGRIKFAHVGADPVEHVGKTMAAVEQLQRGKKP